jgi:predicted class III extradiol MEMO1 family dioxygenase
VRSSASGAEGSGVVQVLLQAIKAAESTRFDVRFVRYAQSSRCKNKHDSSVSYASAIAEVQLASS